MCLISPEPYRQHVCEHRGPDLAVCRLRCGNDASWKSWKSQKSDFPPIPTTLGYRTKRGFPHSPSDGGCEYYKGQCSRTARIAGLYRFSRRTSFVGLRYDKEPRAVVREH